MYLYLNKIRSTFVFDNIRICIHIHFENMKMIWEEHYPIRIQSVSTPTHGSSRAGAAKREQRLVHGRSSWREQPEQRLMEEVDQLELELDPGEDGASCSRDFELEELD
jgi:hypothetical protein